MPSKTAGAYNSHNEMMEPVSCRRFPCSLDSRASRDLLHEQAQAQVLETAQDVIASTSLALNADGIQDVRPPTFTDET